VPEATVVAKRFTLVQAAHAAGFRLRSFILLEAFCGMLENEKTLIGNDAQRIPAKSIDRMTRG
jgi:hypothetical protein